MSSHVGTVVDKVDWSLFPPSTYVSRANSNSNNTSAEYCHPDDGGDTFLRYVGSYKSHMASYPRGRHSSMSSSMTGSSRKLSKTPPRVSTQVERCKNYSPEFKQHFCPTCWQKAFVKSVSSAIRKLPSEDITCLRDNT
jgi:hypothetical protein